MKMKKLFPFVNLVLFSVLLISCSDFNVFKDVAFGSDMESVENILAQKKIKYKSHLAAAQEFLDIDLENTEEIADAIANKHAGGLGEYLYKDYIYYLQKICGMTFQSSILFFDGKCTNIKLEWHIKSNPSMRNSYLASEKLRAYIASCYPDKEFVPEEDEYNDEKFVMQVSDRVYITIKADGENLRCDIEDSYLQGPYREYKNKINDLVDYY